MRFFSIAIARHSSILVQLCCTHVYSQTMYPLLTNFRCLHASPELAFVPGYVLVWLASGLRQGSTALQPRDAARAAEGQLQSKLSRMSRSSSWEMKS